MIISRRALLRLSLLGLVASPLLSPAAADAVAGVVGNFDRSEESHRFLASNASKTQANSFILGKPGTSYALGFATDDCNTSALTMVALDLSSLFQMWNYHDSTSIQSIACPNKVITASLSCNLVNVSDRGSASFQEFSFQDVVDLSDDEITEVTITSAACDNVVLSDGGSLDASIGSMISMRESKNDNWLFIDLSYGKNYFHPLREFTSATSDLNYAASISMSTDGSRIAISGSEVADGTDTFRGFVKLFDGGNTLLHSFMTESIDEVTPIVNVVISGDGNTLAIGAVFPTGEDLVSGVEVFDLTGKNGQDKYSQIGTIIAAGVMGDLPGLRLDMSEDGSDLIVGGRNYESGRGRVMLYTIDPSADIIANQIKISFEWKGAVDSKDHLGSSVSTSRTGQYIAIGGTGVIRGDDGPMTGAVKVYDTVKGKFIGGVIYGASATSDATGFSVDLVEIGDILYVAVASIFSGIEGNSNRGKVDIFKLSSNSEENALWEKVGKSLEGDRGATLDFINGKYHIGDSFGFSLGLVKMKKGGLRVAVGSPFFSNVRESDAYYGVVKLFEYREDEGSWVQIAYDIVGNTRTSASGTSIALVNGGDTLAIGGGPDGASNGNVIVYIQEETSSKPSSMPSVVPSIEPSSRPSSVPSSQPSLIPSKKPSTVPSSQPSSIPSNEPSSVPSSQPSSAPSKVPSTVPSSIPSSQPSLIPSKKPSTVPSSIPSSQPSLIPSKKPSTVPSSIPSSQPSSVPSKEPSSVPSSVPSSKPSFVPSEKPSSYPSNAPSSKPSFVPSQHPSNIPSARPSISHEPSSQPSDFEDREFMILSQFKKLTDLPMGAREDKNWCLERIFSVGNNGGNPLKMRPCETGNNKQMWFYDRQEAVIKHDEFCVARNGKQLVSIACTARSMNVGTFISDDALNLSKKGDAPTQGSISMKTLKHEFYFAVDSIRIFSRVKLLKKGTENSSFDKWQLRYKGPSEFPSSIPTSNPSNEPSTGPSVDLSSNPSNKPSTGPSVDPSSNPSNKPSRSSTIIEGVLKWVPVYTKGTLSEDYAEANRFNAIWAQSPNQILRRKCLDCRSTHQDIYYRRFDTSGLPSGFDLLDLVLKNWFSDPKINHNDFKVDFKLYSTYDDALNDNNEWKYCNFNDPGIGFPRDCGPTSYVGGNWNSLSRGGKSNIGFYVEGMDEIPSSNIALGKKASQSSNYMSNPKFGASKVVNGDTRHEEDVGHENEISHTMGENEPWWQVELGDRYYISRVVIYNREKCSQRLSKYRLEIFDDNASSAVFQYDDTTSTSVSPGDVVSIDVPAGTIGRTVKISIPGRTEFLHLREVEVLGYRLSS